MKKYIIVTKEGKQVMSAEPTTYEACERIWNACGGIYEDEEGEHRIYIEEAK